MAEGWREAEKKKPPDPPIIVPSEIPTNVPPDNPTDDPVFSVPKKDGSWKIVLDRRKNKSKSKRSKSGNHSKQRG